MKILQKYNLFLFQSVIGPGGGLVVQPPQAAEFQKQQNKDFKLKMFGCQKILKFSSNK